MSVQSTYGLNPIDIDLPTAITAVVPAKSSTRTIKVQRIAFWPNTWAQATLTFSDSVTGVVIGTLTVPASPPALGDGSNMIYADFTPTGTKLSQGASLNLAVSLGGAAGRLHIDSYQIGH